MLNWGSSEEVNGVSSKSLEQENQAPCLLFCCYFLFCFHITSALWNPILWSRPWTTKVLFKAWPPSRALHSDPTPAYLLYCSCRETFASTCNREVSVQSMLEQPSQYFNRNLYFQAYYGCLLANSTFSLWVSNQEGSLAHCSSWRGWSLATS